MKRIVVILILAVLCIAGSSQKPFKGFFKPVPNTLLTVSPNSMRAGVIAPTSKWLFRPVVEVSALQLYYNKDTKSFDATSFTSLGMGVGYQHFIEVNDEIINNWGVNALFLFEAIPTETTNAGMSGAITVSALKFINLGAGYNFSNKKMFLLTGVTYNF